MPKRYEFRCISEIDDYLKASSGLEQEGFVCHYPNGLRLKMKSEDYKRLHRIMTATSTITIWEILSSGGSLDKLLQSVPDEFYNWLHNFIGEITEQKNTHIAEARVGHMEAEKLSTRKEQALFILENYPESKAMIFALLDDNEKQAEKIAWQKVRPKGKKVFVSVADSSGDV
jgi:RNA ligase